jgi:hypothetical protein
MPRLHPLITEAVVRPGPAFPVGHGHRATVTYGLLPGPPVQEQLFFDLGGHWGATPDHADIELAMWALVPVVLTTVLGLVGGLLVGRRMARGRAAP